MERDSSGRLRTTSVVFDPQQSAALIRAAGAANPDLVALPVRPSPPVFVEPQPADTPCEPLAAPSTASQVEADSAPPRASAPVDWATFWTDAVDDVSWLFEDVLAWGRGHLLYAAHKEGKSLFSLFIAAELATKRDDVAVTYLDYEMGSDDVRERLGDMGYGPDSELGRLRYHLLSDLSPLDTAEGGRELDELLDAAEVAQPGAHHVVFLDTYSRAVVGVEDAADTTRAFYRHAGIRLKRRGATWLRLDHSGKDKSRGARGSSAKVDDVDVAWQLVKTDAGVELRRDAARMSWVPAVVKFRTTDDPLAFVRAAGDWPLGTGEVAARLDELDVALDASTRSAQGVLRDAGKGKRRELVAAALRFRNVHDGVPK